MAKSMSIIFHQRKTAATVKVLCTRRKFAPHQIKLKIIPSVDYSKEKLQVTYTTQISSHLCRSFPDLSSTAEYSLEGSATGQIRRLPSLCFHT
jgi:hypothetical protein